MESDRHLHRLLCQCLALDAALRPIYRALGQALHRARLLGSAAQPHLRPVPDSRRLQRNRLVELDADRRHRLRAVVELHGPQQPHHQRRPRRHRARPLSARPAAALLQPGSRQPFPRLQRRRDPDAVRVDRRHLLVRALPLVPQLLAELHGEPAIERFYRDPDRRPAGADHGRHRPAGLRLHRGRLRGLPRRHRAAEQRLLAEQGLLGLLGLARQRRQRQGNAGGRRRPLQAGRWLHQLARGGRFPGLRALDRGAPGGQLHGAVARFRRVAGAQQDLHGTRLRRRFRHRGQSGLPGPPGRHGDPRRHSAQHHDQRLAARRRSADGGW